MITIRCKQEFENLERESARRQCELKDEMEGGHQKCADDRDCMRRSRLGKKMIYVHKRLIKLELPFMGCLYFPVLYCFRPNPWGSGAWRCCLTHSSIRQLSILASSVDMRISRGPQSSHGIVCTTYRVLRRKEICNKVLAFVRSSHRSPAGPSLQVSSSPRPGYIAVGVTGGY